MRKSASKISTIQKVKEINSETSLRRKVMMRAWLLKKTCGVRKSFSYKTQWGSIEEQSYSVYDFSSCLKRAWEIEKAALEEKKRKPESIAFQSGAEAWYQSGQIYYGD